MRYLFLLIILFTGNAHGSFTGPGNEWITYARSFMKSLDQPDQEWADIVNTARWQSVVIGLTSAYTDPGYRFAICYPKESTVGQNAEIAARYLIDNPELRAKSADFLIWKSHLDAYGAQQNPDCWKHDEYMKIHTEAFRLP